MEFGFTEEQETLRKELYDFYARELPEDVTDVPAVSKELQDFWMDLQKKAGRKGYLTPGWSKETGGLGLGHMEAGVANEVEGYWGIRWPNGVGLQVCGPGLHLFGTEEQKKNFLPEISSGEKIWYECFTEPEAGTDEANQQTRAKKQGDKWIINGQKIYITGGYKPDLLLVEARTADTVPKHKGLTLFCFSAETPGVTVAALPCMGGYLANIFYFDDVMVGDEAVIGQINQGFYHVMETFEFERSNTYGAARARRDLHEMVQFCRETKKNGEPLIKNPEIRKALAKMAVDIEVLRLATWRTAWRFGERDRLGPLDFDLTGLFARLNGIAHSVVRLNILGVYGQLRRGSKYAKLSGDVERDWQYTRSMHYAGTLEAVKIVLAGRVLGLPRIPAKLNKTIMEALQEKK
ncbi:MAG: acyl-CoA/acyl-ACP dehydrogenase [Syntrophales bacterium]|jgi:alkylation response protein AidB-like acyl-CoA dehydrogenase|nr:acyl-CoA/acyl-ACP dehydrogenase [Syntrophales bacterium]MDY0045222.1 acyl-CoA dehydrogenase family protein [Syntrophales bacterium]